MKINIVYDENAADTEITVICRRRDADTEKLLAAISLCGSTIVGKSDGELFFIPLGDIYYFESVDGKLFFSTEHDTYECAARLCKIEESLVGTYFVRVSKAVIANLQKLRSIKSEEYGRLCASLVNGERIIVSRSYVSDIKRRLGV